MLLTVTTTHRPATDLGYLLHKHPDRVQQFEQSFGTATVFYPEATEQRCTAALMLEVDSVRLARSRGRNSVDFSLAQYVNDRSYAASSLLGVALGRVFSTARSGRCPSRQELADAAIPLEILLPVTPCRGGPAVARRIFEPLGWQVAAEPIPLDETFPAWGDSHYVRLQLRGVLRLADALNQLHILLPVLDETKHYWQGPDEVDKLMRSGEGWLAGHPDRELITRRYLSRSRSLTRSALARLAEVGDDLDESIEPAEAAELDTTQTTPVPLNQQRHEAVLQVLRELAPRSVIDLGCGPGQLLERLVRDTDIGRITGSDVSVRSLRQAARRLGSERLSERQAERIALFQGALTYTDERYAGFDAAVLMEVIEHVDPSRLDALERVVFGAARPGAVIVTTPNSEYNAILDARGGHRTGSMRHSDHRFEWNRQEFAAWSDHVGTRFGYRVERRGVGDGDTTHGTPTQMAVFTREEGDDD